jgi:hypothetical protein
MGWKGKSAVVFLGFFLVMAILAPKPPRGQREQAVVQQQEPAPPPPPRAEANPKKARAIASLDRVKLLATFVAGTKDESACAGAAVNMTQSFVQASLDAGGWDGLAKLRKTYEASCAAICEQDRKTGCYMAIGSEVDRWKAWIESEM